MCTYIDLCELHDVGYSGTHNYIAPNVEGMTKYNITPIFKISDITLDPGYIEWRA